MLVAGIPVVELNQHGNNIAASMQPGSPKPPDLPVSEDIGQTGDGGQGSHDQACPEKPYCGGYPLSVRGIEIGQVTEEGRDEKRNRKRDQHRMDRMSGDARRTARVSSHEPLLFVRSTLLDSD